MNYNHLYHAGTIADIIKHLSMVHIINYYQQKSNPLLLIDTHSAQGLYDVNSVESLKTGEFLEGFERFKSSINLLLPEFNEIIKNAEEFSALRKVISGSHQIYPGSAYIMRYLMRENDKCIFVEKNPKIFKDLQRLGGHNIHLHNKNGYEVLNAVIPDQIKRGFIHIDPPFENKSEFDDIIECLNKVIPKFSNATYMIWYPIKDIAAVKKFYKQLSQLSKECIILETKFDKVSNNIGALDKFGIYVINPTWHLQNFWLKTLQAMQLEHKIITNE